MQAFQESTPSWLQNFDQNVVVDVWDEMCHLVVGKIEPVELRLEGGAQAPELLLIWHSHAPGDGKHVLDLFQLEHEWEDFIVVTHHFLSKNSRQWRQIWHFVVKEENFPASIFLARL